ncbi:transferrin-binding protein-like solute binding protein [Pacificimonas sp. ICDLI1SI03]
MEISGIAQEFSYEANATRVTAVSAPSNVNNATYTTRFDGDRVTTDIDLDTAGTDLRFSVSGSDEVADLGAGLFAAVNEAETDILIAVDPYQTGWDYQSFGVWESGIGTGSGTAGAVSIGNSTAANAVPTTGEATFSGLLGGVYLSPEGLDVLVGADVQVEVDFASRSAELASFGTMDVISGASYNELNLGGELTWASGANSLTGRLASQNGLLTGEATAKFYGPGAQEIGGVFALTPVSGTGVESFGGGFGAVSP